MYIRAAIYPETVRQHSPPAYDPHTCRLIVQHLPKALLLALLVGGCGVDYQKCESIKSALVSAQADIKNARLTSYDMAIASYMERDCTQADLERIAEGFGYKPSDELYAYNNELFETRCRNEVSERYRAQILEEKEKNPIVIEAISREQKIAADYKWNRCM